MCKIVGYYVCREDSDARVLVAYNNPSSYTSEIYPTKLEATQALLRYLVKLHNNVEERINEVNVKLLNL